MESLSKEDLVKYVKKQAQLMQKSKGKYDGKMELDCSIHVVQFVYPRADKTI